MLKRFFKKEANTESDKKAMLQACANDDLPAVRDIVSRGGDVNCTDSDNMSALMWSLNNGHNEVSTYLVSQGCDLAIRDTDGWTALHIACSYNAPAHIIASMISDMPTELLNSSDKGGSSALDRAVWTGHVAAVRLLSQLTGTAWHKGRLVGMAGNGHKNGWMSANGQRYLSAAEHGSMLAVLEELDRERKGEASSAMAEEREAEKKREEERNQAEAEKKIEEERKKQAEAKKKREEERKRQEEAEKKREEERMRQAEAEKKRKEERKRQAEAENKRKKERKRQAEAENNAKIKREREKRRQEEEEKQNEMKRKEEEERQKYLVDESDFAAMCRVSEPGQILKYLEYNPDLLNCLSGQPLREAIMGDNLPVMDTLMNQRGIEVNLKNEHGLSALHMGTSLDQPAAIQRLLEHPEIEVNPVSKKGLTPIKIAASKGKVNALKVLLEDSRTNFREVDEEGNALEDLIGTGLRFQLGVNDTAEARRLFHQARNRSNKKDRKKTVVFILNSDYSEGNLDSLHYQQDDFDAGEKVFKDRQYEIHKIKDSDNILEDVCTLIEEKNIKDSARDIFQLVYSGHGVHKAMVEKGRETAENAAEIEFKQKGKFGDCLVNTDGSLCSELELALNISKELSEETKICLFYDMCRNQVKDLGKQKEFLKIDTFKYEKEFEENGADRRTVRVYSAKLGQRSKDFDSFFRRICQEINKSCPAGMKFSQMKNFERNSQNCQIKYAGGEDWDEQWWPLV